MADKDLTAILSNRGKVEDQAASELLAVAYDDLRRIARSYMRHERADHTLQATALVHEAWLRLSKTSTPLTTRQEFFAAMAGSMRRQLVDHARRRAADKRNRGVRPLPVSDSCAAPAPEASEVDPLAELDAALLALAAAHARPARVLELRFFGQKSIEETARELGIATGTVKRDFVFARAFIAAHMTNPER